MIPILFDKTETTFISNGIGRLSDAISCIVTEERNGSYELKMVYPITGVHYAELTHSRIIFAQPAEGKSNQAFRIYKITKPISGRITILAQHISYQLNNIPVSPFTADSAADALTGLVSNAVTACPFTVWTDIAVAANFALTTPESFRSAFGGMTGNILEVYGGEAEWDMYTVKLHAARGEDRGKIISYGKNITTVSQEENVDKVITGIYPFYNGAEYVELPEKIMAVATSESYGYQRIEKLDLTKYFTDTPSQGDLRDKAQEYLDKNILGIPRMTIKASFVDEENHVPVYLCDTVTVNYAPLNITVQSKVSKLEYNTLLERYETITVGIVQDSIVDAMITNNQKTHNEIETSEKKTSSQITDVSNRVAVISAEVARISGAVMANYVLPFGISLDEIRDTDQGGQPVNVLMFRLQNDTEGNTATLYTLLAFNVHTYEKNDNMQDAVVTIEYIYDERVIQTQVEYFRDGWRMIMLNAILGDMSEGIHTFYVRMSVQGASLF